MQSGRRKRFTLMPLIAVAGLSLGVTLPVLSSAQLHAAQPVAFATVTVRTGDTLWSIAARRTSPDGDVQAAVDQIIAVNHLGGAAIQPGEELRVPE